MFRPKKEEIECIICGGEMDRDEDDFKITYKCEECGREVSISKKDINSIAKVAAKCMLEAIKKIKEAGIRIKEAIKID